MHGLSGVGIFADQSLEALYIGDDLNSSQLAAITSGDASPLVLDNRLWSYRSDFKFCHWSLYIQSVYDFA